MAYRVEELPIDKIKVQKHNVRIHDIDIGVDDLAASIKAHGLLEPIVAYKNGDTYFILTGQRRLNAYDRLNEKYPDGGYDRIPCFVREEPESDDKKKALSLAENITQLPMAERDLIKAVTDLYNVYGDYEIVQDKFGLTKYMVDKYVKISRLPDEIQSAIADGKIHTNPKTATNVALKAVDAYQYTKDGETPIDAVLELAVELGRGAVDPQDARKGVRMGKSVREIIEMKDDKVTLKIRLATDVDEKLDKVAKSKASPKDDMATQYVVEGVERDYAQVEDI